MSTDQAISLVSQVFAMYKGTLEEHNNLQTALKVITEAIQPVVQADAVEEAKEQQITQFDIIIIEHMSKVHKRT